MRDVANTPLEASQPSWSPDSNSLVYSSNELDDRQSRIYIVPARGAPEQRDGLKFSGKDLIGRYPTWLQNGQIVYEGTDAWSGNGRYGIVRVNPDGNSPTMLTSGCGDANRCIDTAPSGFGDTVVFMSNRGGNWDIYSVPLAGGEARNLTKSPGEDGLPTFSPDGNFIAFVSNRTGQWAMWVMRRDGSEQQQLFPLEGSYGVGGDVEWTTERISWGP